MAIYRQVHLSIWQDKWFSELESSEKLLWVYLLTNPKTTQSGVYEFSTKYAVFETGLSRKEVEDALQSFIKAERVLYDQETEEIMIVNWLRYNSARSPKVAAVIDKEIESIKSSEFKLKVITTAQHYEYPIRAKAENLDMVSEPKDIVSVPYGYTTDTISQPEQNQNHNQNHNQQQNQNEAEAPVAAADITKRVYDLYQQTIGVLNPVIMTEIADWIKDMTPEVVEESLKRTAANGGQWTYARGILRNWDKKNIRTMEQVDADDTAHRNAIERNKGSFGKPKRVEARPDWMDPNYQPPKEEVTPEMEAQLAANQAKLAALRQKNTAEEAGL
ncbi:DnaD domain-containing protein [Lacticaseibacillus saniviri]|uniref:DnaD domain-containing protein n=1 Tax=Lacticaseibacillus saniviri TaxID=931533 RepID=UPI001EE0F965|nr:DnaD domain protein [Lacticaseibacillus saniviri]MCG4280891.1 DnaD domain protein [Lacticaseibacillus saniviri]